MKSSPPELPILSFKTIPTWVAWLKKHHAKEPGLRLRLFKKGSGEKSITYAEALDVALCYGWIDGVKNTYDKKSWLQRFTPRRARSKWSKNNTGHVERLIKEKRMQPAGLVQIEAAKKDGRWEAAYGSQKNIEPPTDFLKELSKNMKAKTFFESLNKANVYAIVYRLTTAKKPETRERRMTQILEMMKEGKTFH
jgi:uncharacterized protein YdeI (YjbR/CyaY-like superfamily)